MPLISDLAGVRRLQDEAWRRGWGGIVKVELWHDVAALLGAGNGDVFACEAGDDCEALVSKYGEAWALKAFAPAGALVGVLSNKAWRDLEKPEDWITEGHLKRKPSDPIEVGGFAMAVIGKEVMLARVEAVDDKGRAVRVKPGKHALPIDAASVSPRWLLCSKWPDAALLQFNRDKCLFPSYINFLQQLGKRQKEIDKKRGVGIRTDNK